MLCFTDSSAETQRCYLLPVRCIAKGLHVQTEKHHCRTLKNIVLHKRWRQSGNLQSTTIFDQEVAYLSIDSEPNDACFKWQYGNTEKRHYLYLWWIHHNCEQPILIKFLRAKRISVAVSLIVLSFAKRVVAMMGNYTGNATSTIYIYWDTYWLEDFADNFKWAWKHFEWD